MIAVIGEGWAALGTVGFLVTSGKPVHWITGTGARMHPPLPSLPFGEDSSAVIWTELARRLEVEISPEQVGSYLREFRNKAFREPAWVKAPSLEARQEVIRECLWEPEQTLVGAYETRYAVTLNEIEEAIRSKLTPENYPNLRRTDDVPVTGIRTTGGAVTSLALASGEEIEVEQVIFADRWSAISQVAGLPKGMTFIRKRGELGVLQATFSHETPIGQDLQEGFFNTLQKESGEQRDRHLWGYFDSTGKRSFWTICLSAEEVEDNHEIAKRLRRLKSSLDKMFTGSDWLPEGKTEFMQNVCEEQVRLEESVLFSQGNPVREAVTIDGYSGLSFMTDGYGPMYAMMQVGGFALSMSLGMEQPKSETENVDLVGAQVL